MFIIHVGCVKLGDEAPRVLSRIFVHFFCISTSNCKILVGGGPIFDCLIFLSCKNSKLVYFFAQIRSKNMSRRHSLSKPHSFFKKLTKICSYLLHNFSNHIVHFGVENLFDLPTFLGQTWFQISASFMWNWDLKIYWRHRPSSLNIVLQWLRMTWNIMWTPFLFNCV